MVIKENKDVKYLFYLFCKPLNDGGSTLALRIHQAEKNANWLTYWLMVVHLVKKAV